MATINTNHNYEKILQDNLKDELQWLENEFMFQFKNKKKKTKEDITLGNQILNNIIDSIKADNSEEVLNLLAITLNRIEHDFPEFF
ncbi:MAG: hypothetical protein ACFE9X_02510 [Promethearchaeota archaeon]